MNPPCQTDARPLRIGLFGIGLDVYWPQKICRNGDLMTGKVLAAVVVLMPGVILAAPAPTSQLAAVGPPAQEGAATPESAAQRKQDERRQFQAQELITAQPGTWIFKPGETPRIVWRDVEAVQRLGGDTRLRVRWFDAKLNEFPRPTRPAAGSPGSRGPHPTARRFVAG